MVHENAGRVLITVTRGPVGSAIGAQVRYITSGDGYNPSTNSPFQCGAGVCTATSEDFRSVKGELDFQPGELTRSFSVRVVDHGIATVPKTFQVSLFGPSPIGLGPVSKAPVTILEDDPLPAVEPGNPLGLPGPPAGGDRAGQPRSPAQHRRADGRAGETEAEPGGEPDRDRHCSRVRYWPAGLVTPNARRKFPMGLYYARRRCHG